MRALGFIVCLLVPGWAHALPSVALDLTGLDGDSFAALDGVALEKSATVRLVQDGFAVVARTASPDVVLRVGLRPEPRVLVLSSHGPGGDATSDVPWADEPLVELHLELVQKLVELTRATATAKLVIMPPAPPPPRERPWHLSLGGGGLVREGGFDPLGLLGVRWGLRYRVALEAGFSGRTSATLSVFEAQLSAGGALALPLTTSLELEFAVLIGALVHHFWLADRATFEPEGTRFNALVTVPVTLWLAVNEAVRVGLRFALGWGQARAHLDGEQTLWTRGAPRAEFGLTVAFAP